MKLQAVYNCIYNAWRVYKTRVLKSLTGNNLQDTLSRSLWGNKNQSQTSETSELTARLSLAERWTITENSQTIKFCADLFPAHRCPPGGKVLKMARTRERELIMMRTL